jgi:cob(I)alamin adenosyltransferase
MNATTIKTLVATEQVELSEEELEARGIHRQIRLTESDVEYLDAEIERVEGIKEASSSSSSSSGSSESSYLPMKVVRSQEREI